MSGDVQKVVLLPRFTTFVGAGEYFTAPVNVRRFAEGLISVWRGKASGTGLDAFQITLQESPDLEIWNDVGSPIVAAANVEASGTVEFDLEWVRLKAELVLSSPPPASDPSVSCWAVGNLVPRESPQE